MKLLHYSAEDHFLTLNTDKGTLFLLPVTPEIVRVVFTRGQEMPEKQSLMVVNGPEHAAFTVCPTDSTMEFSTGKIRISIDRKTGCFRYYDGAGRLLVREPEQNGKILTEFDLEKTVFPAEGGVKLRDTADGIRVDAQGEKVFDRRSFHFKLSFCFADGEALYGLGSHEEGVLNLRGHSQYLYQQNLKAVVPMLVSTQGYGILVDNYSLMTFRDDQYGSYLWAEAADEMDYYFIYGPEFDKVIAGYRHLTGPVPMLPRSAFGYIQSKERYTCADELLEVAEEYRRRRVPLDMVVLDWKSWPGELWGQKSFDPERFPDPKGLTDALHEKKVKMMVSIWPIMRKGGENHTEMQQHGFLLGNNSTYDAFNPAARALYWKQAREGIFENGTDAWWCDCTEPFEADWFGSQKPEPEQRLAINADEARKYLDPQYVGAYSLEHSRGIYEGQRSYTDRKRVLNLTRSSYAGQHRYATVTWSGDISANWDTLKKQIPAGLNFCAAGEPYWSLDVGGFFVKNKEDQWFWSGDYEQGCEDLGYRELYVRFLQLGAFLPMFRSHGTDTPREIWRFGEPGSLFYDAILRFIRLRYRLMPYLYSLSAMVSRENYTMLRALVFDFQSDPKVYDIKDEFMFGPSLLICPVTRPMYYESGSRPLANGPRTRRVYLPAGCDWYDFFTGRRYGGGTELVCEAPLDTIPIFVRAGSILPLGPADAVDSAAAGVFSELWAYPGNCGAFTLYEDDGETYDYEKGAFASTCLRWDEDTCTLSAAPRSGSFAGMQTAARDITAVRAGDGLSPAGSKKAGKARTLRYDGTALSIHL